VDDSLAQRWGRWLAREDTVRLPQYLLKNWVPSSAERPTLKEILGWCIDGESKRKELVDDVTFIRRSRVVALYGDPEDTTTRREVEENVEKVYLRSPNEEFIVELGSREWDSKSDNEEVNVGVEVKTSTGHLVDLPFFFKALDDYSFKILDRKIFSDRVIYKIEFTPRSEFEPLPEGWFLVDTRDYQIVHGEFRWTRNVPFPLFLKSVDRVVMTRRKHEEVWLPDRIIISIRLRDIPFVSTPELVVVDIRHEEIQLNAGIPDSIFAR
ncbi:MAG: hypothetical protein KJ831_03410, partial [Candidatus Eisenbacteria bacterium]|nr:hypothetical protein [Candidatus Eisenbacteria bacterium]